VQNEILTKHPAADLDVYVVWFDMYPGDARWRWDGGGLTDPRVTHFWDEDKTVGTWFSPNLTHRKAPTWDFFALYPAGARDLASPGSTGGTIIGDRDELQSALGPILASVIAVGAM
jgi:hypothetical protein